MAAKQRQQRADGPRIERDMSFADYLAHPGFGSGDTTTMRTSVPLKVDWNRKHRHADTEATRLGVAAHCAILTPQLLRSQYVVRPEGTNLRTAKGRAQRDAWQAAGLMVLSQDERTALLGVRTAFQQKRAAADALRQATGIECSIFWRHDGVQLKARPDWWVRGSCVYELKVSVLADMPPERMHRRVFWSGWVHQLAHNQYGLRQVGQSVTSCRLVIVSPKPPHLCWLLQPSAVSVAECHAQNVQQYQRLRDCAAEDQWPGTPEDWQELLVESARDTRYYGDEFAMQSDLF